LRTRLARAAEKLADPECRQLKDAAGIYYFEQPLHPGGRIAFLFPGEGAQYLNMLGDLCAHFPEVSDTFADCDRTAARAQQQGKPFSRVFLVPPDATAAEKADAERALRQIN